MAFLIRALVSADRQRFKQGEHDLDLTYITPRIIAMGFPASGLEGAWRNPIDEVAIMLKKYHSGKYMIWNLSDRPYDYSIFEDQVMEFGFPDHHAPPLNLLFKIMLSLYNWIRADPLNIAVIHCLGGKGRTGTVIACYFLLTGLFDDPNRGLEYFANKRSNIALGVTQPGQKCYVGYFAKILQQNMIPYQVPYCLAKIVMYGVNQQLPNAFRPVIKVCDVRSYPKKRIYATDCPEEAENNAKRWTSEVVPNNTVVWMFPKHLMTVKGDVLVKVYHMPVTGGKKIFVFRFSFHTAFLEGGVLSLTEADLSAEKRFTTFRKDNSFFIHLFFEEPTETPSADDDPENAYIETYCKKFQKIYAERNVIKLDALDPNYVMNTTSTNSTTTTSFSGNTTTTTVTTTTTSTTKVRSLSLSSSSVNSQKQKPLPPPPPLSSSSPSPSSSLSSSAETINGNNSNGNANYNETSKKRAYTVAGETHSKEEKEKEQGKEGEEKEEEKRGDKKEEGKKREETKEETNEETKKAQ